MRDYGGQKGAFAAPALNYLSPRDKMTTRDAGDRRSHVGKSQLEVCGIQLGNGLFDVCIRLHGFANAHISLLLGNHLGAG